VSLRIDLENAPDVPKPAEATEESYTDNVKILGKYFLKTLDEWTDFDKDRDWKEFELGEELYARSQDKLPKELTEELTGAQVGFAAHLAYSAYVQTPA